MLKNETISIISGQIYLNLDNLTHYFLYGDNQFTLCFPVDDINQTLLFALCRHLCLLVTIKAIIRGDQNNVMLS